LVIRRNRFRGFFDGLCVCPFNHGPFNTLGRTNETDVYENDVSNCRDDGIETDGQCANVRIWSNRFRECYQGISLSPVLTGPVYCIRNVAWGRVNHRLFKIGWNGHRGAMYLFHNTSHTATGLMAAGKTVTWDLLFARNNAWHSLGGATAWGFALNVDADLPGHPVDLDYDNFARQWAVDNGSDVLGVWQGEPASLRVVQEKARQYLHGRNAFPGFVNAETGDFALRPDSPLVDAGIHVPGINDDFAGAAPDIGAVESGVARRE
jgi:hypothetical protein